MRRWIQAIACALAVAWLFAGCAGFPAQQFNREAHRDIETIALVPPPPRPEYVVNIVYHPGASFGLIGGLIAAGELSSKGSSFNAAMRPTDFDVNAELMRALAEELSSSGKLRVVVDTNSVSVRKAAFLEDYASVGGDARFVLDAYVSIAGFSAASHTTPYRPILGVPARLVDKRTKSVLYAQLFSVGSEARQGMTQIADEDQYAPANFESLVQDPQRAAEALRSSVRRIAKQIAADLVPP